MIHLALYHPQIPQNTGTLLRLSSCLGINIDIIMPIGFIFDNKKLKRSSMDYFSSANYKIHTCFDDFLKTYENRRIIALNIDEKSVPYNKFKYEKNDILIVGSEHYGFLKNDIEKIHYQIKIPMQKDKRSLNMAIASSFALSEALSQTDMI